MFTALITPTTANTVIGTTNTDSPIGRQPRRSPTLRSSIPAP